MYKSKGISILAGFELYVRRDFGLADIINQLVTVLSYAGYHKWDIPEQTVEEQVISAQWGFATQLVYHPLMGAIRASIVMFLFRLQDLRSFIQLALHTVFWLNIGYAISTTIANLCTCSPVSYSWDKAATDRIVDGELVPGGKCFNTLVFVLISGGLNMFMDLIIIPIPTAMVWNLTMPKRTKIAVVLVMGMGWVATAISAVRFAIYYYRWQPDNTDRNYSVGYTISVVEPNVGMWAACIPALKHLLRVLWPNLFGSTASNGYRTTQDPWSTPSKTRARTWSRKRDSLESLYRLGRLGHGDGNIDSTSQEHIIARPPPPAGRGVAVKDPNVVTSTKINGMSV
ncbi:hypothetical protein AJ79_01425 [Helicocarpus griseus UAMH5409]|uniref:Rhodopsin domain-containing protein n=1 Tax=Helicocarpus griseus UAMH5409 TaxID=1447875 RepID=A0A2B7Y7K9_9EURO|nr:hypothetical protein AJ79_01425 [Helicocarpus griseus UAMH5409]